MEKSQCKDRLTLGNQLTEGEYLKSNNGAYFAVLQKDGNFVVYVSCDFQPKNCKWSSNSDGKGRGPYTLRMQKDGNLVLYDADNQSTWSTRTDKTSGSYVVMQDDETLVLYDRNNEAIWRSNAALD